MMANAGRRARTIFRGPEMDRICRVESSQLKKRVGLRYRKSAGQGWNRLISVPHPARSTPQLRVALLPLRGTSGRNGKVNLWKNEFLLNLGYKSGVQRRTLQLIEMREVKSGSSHYCTNGNITVGGPDVSALQRSWHEKEKGYLTITQ